MSRVIAQKILLLEAELAKLKKEQEKSLAGDNVNVLVVGSGGREHTIAWKLSQSKRAGIIYFAPGNGGTNDEKNDNSSNNASIIINRVGHIGNELTEYILPGTKAKISIIKEGYQIYVKQFTVNENKKINVNLKKTGFFF